MNCCRFVFAQSSGAPAGASFVLCRRHALIQKIPPGLKLQFLAEVFLPCDECTKEIRAADTLKLNPRDKNAG